MTADKILFVDDDQNVLAGLRRSFYNRFALTTAASGDEALRHIAQNGPFAVIVADMQMPGMNGVQLLRRAQEQSPDTVRLMLTGNADQKTAADAVNQGHVYSFLTKPCAPELLAFALTGAVKQHKLIVAEKELLEKTLNGAVTLLTDLLSLSDPDAHARGQRLREEMKVIAKWFNAQRTWELELGAMLSQIGRVAVPGTVLVKAQSGLGLTGAEKDMLRRVPESGASLLERIPRLEGVAEIVRYQNKNFDGSGFPANATAGEDIPVGARVLRILSDLLEGESSKRSRFDVLQSLRNTQGLYDPAVLEAVACCFDICVEPTSAHPGRPIKLPEITAGMTLTEDVRTTDGTLLVLGGTRITAPLIEKLRNFNELSGVKEPLYAR